MKDITFKKIKITNWKGFKKFETELGRTTNIYGRNRAGKSSIMDAIIWCLFGKDAQGRADFELKPLNKDNEPSRKQEHEVELIVMENDIQLKFRRVFREKWVKKRGDTFETFDGHETVLFYQDVPVKGKEYTECVNNVIDESIFRMLTDPNFYHVMHWQKRRELLEIVGGKIEMADIAATDQKFADLLHKLQGKDLELHRKGLVNQRKDINNELEGIQPRIDEVERSKPEPVDVIAVEQSIANITKESDSLTSQIDSILEANKAHDEKIYGISIEIRDLKDKIEVIKRQDKSDYDKSFDTANSQRRIALNKESEHKASIVSIQSKIDRLTAERQELIDKKSKLSAEWIDENAKELKLNETDTKCPVCNSPYDASTIAKRQEEMRNNFNTVKTSLLKSIENRGFKLADEIAILSDNISSLTKELETKKAVKIEIPDEVVVGDYKISEQNQGKIIAIEAQIVDAEKRKAELDSANLQGAEGLKEQRNALQNQITTLKASLQVNKQISDADARIKELESQETELSHQMAAIEKELATMEEMMKVRMDMVEQNIADKFDEIKFKLFERQINEGEKPTCITLFNGVPYEAQNTESRLRMSLQVIRTLQKHYNVMAPIIIDNRESVTEIPDMKCQIVNLIVSPQDEKLRIERL